VRFARLLAVLATEVLEAWKKVENQACDFHRHPHPSLTTTAGIAV